MAREDPARDQPGVPGRAVELFVVCLSHWGAKHWIACLDSHLLQGYPRAWKFPWDETKLCQTLNFFSFRLRIHCAKSMLCVSSQSNSSGTHKPHPSRSAFWSTVPSEAWNDRAATICEICLRSVYHSISSLISSCFSRYWTHCWRAELMSTILFQLSSIFSAKYFNTVTGTETRV